MPQATVGKQFTFHASHKLPNHQGQCKRLHGHSYVLEVLVTGPVKQAGRTESDEGMVVDFEVIKSIYKSWIEPFVEHQYLNERLHPDEIRIVKNKAEHQVPQLPKAPNGEPLTTCENLAEWLQRIFAWQLLECLGISPYSINQPSVCIRLWETPTSFAEVGRAPWRG